MNVLFTTQPGVGHLNPLLPLARGLERAGHQVAFACADSFVPWVEAAGLRAFPAGLDWLVAEAGRVFPELEDMSRQERTVFLTESFVDTGLEMTRDLLEICEAWRPNVVVREGCEYGGCVAAECLDLPHVLVSVDFFTPNYIAKLVLEEPLVYLRSAYGLPPYPALDMLTRYLYFSYIPPSYHFPEYPLPPVTRALRPLFLQPEPGGSAPEWVARLPDQPTVYVSMGTILRVPQVFDAVLRGLRDEPLNLIMSIGRALDPADFGPQPDNVRIEPFIPHDISLLPYCDAVVTHGGANTTLGALSHGLPLLVIPFSGHMLQHGIRCKALGAGLLLRPSGAGGSGGSGGPSAARIPVRQASELWRDRSPDLSPSAVRTAVQALLYDPSYRQAAQALQAEMASLPGLAQAVECLERLAVECSPLTV